MVFISVVDGSGGLALLNYLIHGEKQPDVSRQPIYATSLIYDKLLTKMNNRSVN